MTSLSKPTLHKITDKKQLTKGVEIESVTQLHKLTDINFTKAYRVYSERTDKYTILGDYILIR